jgi:hypothetical protein
MFAHFLLDGEVQNIKKHTLDNDDENSNVSVEEGRDMRLVVAK